MLAADVLDRTHLGLPDFTAEARQPVSRFRGAGYGAVLWLEPRSDGGYEQFIEAVLGTPGAWKELLFSCSSDWSYSEDLYRNELYLSGFTVSATILQKTVQFISGVAPRESGQLCTSQRDDILVLSPDDNPGGYFVVGVTSSTPPTIQWHS